MNSTGAKVALGVAALVVVVALFFILQGGDDDSDSPTTAAETTTTTTEQADAGAGGGGPEQQPESEQKPDIPTIEVKGGEPVGGVQELTFTEGDDIRFRVESDVSDEVHFHGYDVGEDVEAGGSVEFDVPATITGVFEVELEERVVPLAEITVDPS
jgi:hypothetical protein